MLVVWQSFLVKLGQCVIVGWLAFISVCIHLTATHGTLLTASDQLHTCLYAQRICKVLLAAENYTVYLTHYNRCWSDHASPCDATFLSSIISPPRHHPSYEQLHHRKGHAIPQCAAAAMLQLIDADVLGLPQGGKAGANGIDAGHK